ncbi:CIC11C00000001039 [Sungouiella intermedia]|uniref:CIC11C00000001039 n=2 Tax=Sungouiella intermedia TaxID=45354 RepID=A0A1L0D5E6_9ASCO|nr:CIC11C00000001039 [[Candida] intermedia]
MDSRYSWLDSVPQAHTPPVQGMAPPPVSFGSSSNTELASHQEHYKFTNASADNILESVAASQNYSPDSIPLSLTAQELSLEESKTYMRWYSDILARTNQRTISMADVYQFLSNFRLLPETKEKINHLFSKILSLINIGEFFALLRVVSHTLQGKEPSRALIKVRASVPVPPLILSKKRQNDDHDDDFKDESPAPQPSAPAVPLDLDLFTQFMLTGERPEERAPKKRLKKLKSVKFSDQIVTDVHDITPDRAASTSLQPLDYSLPMDQLLNRISSAKHLTVPNIPQPVASPDPEEKQILRDMEGQINHFQNLHSVDTMLIDGVPSNIHVHHGSDFSLPRLSLPQPQLLRPNMTGPAQMAQMFSNQQSDYSASEYQPNEYPSNDFPVSGQGQLRPNITGPADMQRHFSPSGDDGPPPSISLQSFTSQMTGDTWANTNQNANIGHEKQLPPPPVPANRRTRSYSQPSPIHIDWESESRKVLLNQNASPANDHSTNGLMVPPTQRYRSASSSPGPPVPPRSPLGMSRPVPPPPPPSRRTMSVSKSPSPLAVQSIDQIIGDTPPPLPDKIPNGFYQNGDGSSSTANILDDLKALQEEVDKIRDMTGGF